MHDLDVAVWPGKYISTKNRKQNGVGIFLTTLSLQVKLLHDLNFQEDILILAFLENIESLLFFHTFYQLKLQKPLTTWQTGGFSID